MAKILIADDSPTIHKVVQLTLSSSGHELDIAINADELFSKANASHFDLILLDFTLSDKEDGYELARKLNKDKKTKILAMLGTFDSIEDSKMVETGILDKIQKPFESQKFINLCNRLIETDLENFFTAQDALSNDLLDNENHLEDEWVVNNQAHVESDVINLSQNDEPTAAEEITEDDFTNELNSWGVRVPEIIGKDLKSRPDFPPVIEKSKEEHQDLVSMVDDEISDEGNTFDLAREQQEKHKDLSFVSASDLAPEDDDWHTDMNTSHSNEDNRALEKELDDVNSDDFWAIDDHNENPTMTFSTEESHDEVQEEEIRDDLVPSNDHDENPFTLNFEEAKMKDEDLEFPEVKSQPAPNIQASHLDIDEIVERVVARITSQLEEIVKKSIESKIEEISWEVIPDLAENLIKKEIRRISDSVIDSH